MRYAYFSIDYGILGYRAVQIELPSGVKRRFESGDPALDWKNACAAADSRGLSRLYSSSVDNFIHDVPGYHYTDDTMLEKICNLCDDPLCDGVHPG